MRELEIKGQYVKPYTVTTRDSDFSIELKNILDGNFTPESPNVAWCSDVTSIYGHMMDLYI